MHTYKLAVTSVVTDITFISEVATSHAQYVVDLFAVHHSSRHVLSPTDISVTYTVADTHYYQQT